MITKIEYTSDQEPWWYTLIGAALLVGGIYMTFYLGALCEPQAKPHGEVVKK